MVPVVALTSMMTTSRSKMARHKQHSTAPAIHAEGGYRNQMPAEEPLGPNAVDGACRGLRLLLGQTVASRGYKLRILQVAGRSRRRPQGRVCFAVQYTNKPNHLLYSDATRGILLGLVNTNEGSHVNTGPAG